MHSMFNPATTKESVRVELTNADKFLPNDTAEQRAEKVLNYIKKYVKEDKAWQARFAKRNTDKLVEEYLKQLPLSEKIKIKKELFEAMKKQAEDGLQELQKELREMALEQIPSEKIEAAKSKLPEELVEYVHHREQAWSSADRFKFEMPADVDYALMAMVAHDKLVGNSLNLTSKDVKKEYEAVRAAL